MNNLTDPIFSCEEIRFNRLSLDQLKEQDLKVLFQTLMTEPPHRTIADVNGLCKIMRSLEPVKKIRNSSIVYHLCRSMFLAKFKEKNFVYQRQEQAESLYILLSGKIGLYKRNPDSSEQEEVIFMSEGSTFGNAYKWKQKFLPLTLDQVILAVVPKRQLPKIAVKVANEKEQMIRSLSKARVFGSEELIRQHSEALTLHRVSFGSHIIKEGEIPKGLFFILKGTVSKHLQMASSQQKKSEDKSQLTVAEYSAGGYFPKDILTQCLPFSIIADSPCEVISLPKRFLKAIRWNNEELQVFKGQEYYRKEVKKQRQWQMFKHEYLNANMNFRKGKPRNMIF